MKIMRASLLVFAIIGTATDALADPPAPRAIIESSEAAQRLKDITAQATITTDDSSGQRVKTFTLWRRLDADGVHWQSFTRFQTPAEIRGEAILFIEGAGANDVQLWLPRFKKVRRVEAESQSSSFMGSALSYSDLAPPHVDDFSHKLLRTEPCPETAGAQCHVVELTPKNESVIERTGYSKNVQWIRTDNFMMVQTELSDKTGRLWKRLKASDIKEVDTTAHKWYTHALRVEDLIAKRTTTLKLEQLKANTGLSAQLFTAANLARE
jgi:uncharacterized protein